MKVRRSSASPYGRTQVRADDYGIQGFMFLEDLKLYLCPWYKDDLNYIANSSPDSDEDAWRQGALLFSEPYRRSFDLRNARLRELPKVIAQFIVHVGRDLTLNGISAWELASVESDTPGPATLPILVWLGPNVSVGRNKVIQRLASSEDTRASSSRVELPVSRTHLFRLPSCFGSARTQRDRMRLLRESSKLMPSYFLESMNKLEPDAGFQTDEYSRTQLRTIAKSMQPWGWMQRVPDDKHITEYYGFFRLVMFHKAMAILRESIVSDMNAILKRSDIDCEIRLQGLKTVSEIDELLEQLKKGVSSFGDVLDAVRPI